MSISKFMTKSSVGADCQETMISCEPYAR